MSQQYQNDWIKDQEKQWEKWRNYDNLPEGYKAFIKKEDGFRVDSAELTNGTMYTYSVKYWENTDTYSIIRWVKKTGSSSGYRKPPNEYSFTRVEEGSVDDINELAAMGKSAGEKWKYEGFTVLNGQIMHVITRQEKVNNSEQKSYPDK